MTLLLAWGPFMALSLPWGAYVHGFITCMGALYGFITAMHGGLCAWLYHCHGGPLWLYHCHGGPMCMALSLAWPPFIDFHCNRGPDKFLTRGPKFLSATLVIHLTLTSPDFSPIATLFPSCEKTQQLSLLDWGSLSDTSATCSPSNTCNTSTR